MAVFVGFPIKDTSLFFSGSFLGILGIAIVFTFVSVISTSDNGNATLMSILALPLVLPVVLLLLKVSAVSARLLTDTTVDGDLWLLAGIDSMLLGGTLLLFPALWRN